MPLAASAARAATYAGGCEEEDGPLGGDAVLRRGTRIRELTKKVGQASRTGVVLDVRGDTVEVRWDDGHVSSLSGALLVPDRDKQRAK